MEQSVGGSRASILNSSVSNKAAINIHEGLESAWTAVVTPHTQSHTILNTESTSAVFIM